MRNLEYWQEKFTLAVLNCEHDRREMDEREAMRMGSHRIRSTKGGWGRDATNVRNIAFELIETQVDTTIPQPKVTAYRLSDEHKARKLEHKLRNELERLSFASLNDEQERICPTQGSAFFLVEWDSLSASHDSSGELSVTGLHPRQVIPQPGVYEIADMDYLFVLMGRTKEYILKRYGVSVASSDESLLPDTGDSGDSDVVTQILCYYRNDAGGIGLITWVGDTVLEENDDYQARRTKVCKTCGAGTDGEEVCPVCGSKDVVLRTLRQEILSRDLVLSTGEILPAGTAIPYAAPDVYPVVHRKNVSLPGSFLGSSDIAIIADQQTAVAKLGTKIEEKLLKGGSFVTLPKKVRIRRTDEELKVIELDNPADKAMIDVINVQPNMAADMQALELNYQWARSSLGITDSYQGKRDTTATSGRAKEFAANQSAGRLESKRVMKRAAYSELFAVMAKFLVAFTDEPRNVYMEDDRGNAGYEQFSKYDFLAVDAAGQPYYDLDFLFSTDHAASLAANREAMWQETRQNFVSGTFGNPTDPKTQLLFWQLMDSLSYPHAGQIRRRLESGI